MSSSTGSLSFYEPRPAPHLLRTEAKPAVGAETVGLCRSSVQKIISDVSAWLKCWTFEEPSPPAREAFPQMPAISSSRGVEDGRLPLTPDRSIGSLLNDATS